ncbi:acyl--CoA ligase [Verticiella sediminum]|uniref:Acyl--CoA ligase n=1 Tax=Verticiella sediminum TaxID=1247510 RepID=A0A556B135_9BURK|nr:class I adenylate-forming enzyme family protein [Verticiella sediminum]TSH98873.1 acyl--CoA ligase [Verticiella sediminum]
MCIDSSSPAAPLPGVPDRVRQQARQRPQATALVCGERRTRYGELDALADRVGAALQRQGLGMGDVVAVCAATSIEYVAVFLGAVRIGVAVAPLPTTVTAESLAAMAQNAPASLVFADAATTPLVRNAGLGELCVMLDGDLGELAPWPGAAAREPQPVRIDPRWPFNIIYSSGTTGTPKAIMQTHARRAAQAEHGKAFGYGPDAVTLLATPLYSNTTLVGLFATLAAGGAAVLMPKFDVRGYLELAQRERATHTMLVPVQYHRILAEPEFAAFDLSAFRLKICTGAPCPPELKREAVRRWPGGFMELYGTTEGGGSCVLEAHRYPDKLHTVGRPSGGSEFRVIDDGGRELPAGEAGEIVGRSEVMMDGYHGQAAAGRDLDWFDAQGRRFLRSGDIGYFDPDGFLVLVERKKDMIISDGFNVYPSDLEAQLRQHPGVLEAAVVGVPSERWGETPVGFVVRRAGSDADPQAILQWCNQRLGKIQRLAGVQLVAALPRNPLGKVLKRELRDAYLARTAALDPPMGVATAPGVSPKIAS